jgi:alcohol dehydrogenase (cytochrome c)
MTGFRGAVILLLGLSEAGAVAQGVQATPPDRGARQYAVTCAGCHGADGSGSIKGPAIAKQASSIARSDEDLIRIVRDGVPGKGMPGLKMIGDENIQAVVRYLRVLQGVSGGSVQGAGVTDRDATASAGRAATNGSAASARDEAGVRGASGAGMVTGSVALAGVVAFDVQQSDLNQKEVKENWVSYNGDYSGRRYSAMDEVTPQNVRRLKARWSFRTTGAGVMEVTPVVVAGVMFVTRSNDAWAVDAMTGELLWHHGRAVSDGLIDDASGHINRGVAVLGSRVYMETDNAHLLCLNARTGELEWDVAYATGNKNYGATSAPLIVKDKVLVGTSGGDDGVRGFVAAYDAQTGKEAWRFWTIPAPGEKGSESWPGDMYLHGGGTTWMPGTYDAELNTIYWGTGNPSPDFDGSVRPGDDLYTSSLVALDPDTGRLKWYFQFSPHNLYDYDAVQTPVLVDADFRGKPRKLVVTANRNGFLYILDRTDGTYLFSKQFSAGENWAKGIDEMGRPISNGLVPDEKGVTVCPGYSGATNWYSPSYDPATKMFYFRSLEACSLFKAKTEKFEEGQEYYSTGAERPLGNHPEASYLNAFDLDTLDFAWRNVLAGDGEAVAGAMSTAGGLVAFGNDAKQFEMDDARTGKKLWSFDLGTAMHASPMSYGISGRQYFAIAAGDDVIAFSLP